MLNTFDRYLLKRYVSTFLILFISTYGLFVVIDGVTNVDEFMLKAETSSEIIVSFLKHYSYQASNFFNMTGATLCVVSVMVVLGLVLYQRELQPLLAAGIPTYRLARPLLVGVVIVNGMIVFNTEMIIPKVALTLQTSRSGSLSEGKSVEPVQDYELHINIDGDHALAETQSISESRFILTAPFLVNELTTLSSPEAVYYPETEKNPSGWLLKGAHPKFEELKLTELGKEKLFRLKESEDLFIATKVSFQQIYSQGGNYLFDTTPQMIERVNSPAISHASAHRQILYLHNRLSRPFQNIVASLLIIPIVVRRESRSLINSMASASGVLIVMLGIQHLSNFLASAKLVTPDFAVWIPILVGGGLAAWLSEDVLT